MKVIEKCSPLFINSYPAILFLDSCDNNDNTLYLSNHIIIINDFKTRIKLNNYISGQILSLKCFFYHEIFNDDKNDDIIILYHENNKYIFKKQDDYYINFILDLNVDKYMRSFKINKLNNLSKK